MVVEQAGRRTGWSIGGQVGWECMVGGWVGGWMLWWWMGLLEDDAYCCVSVC